MYLYYHVYFITMGALLSYITTPLVGLCTALMYTMFCWFHASAIMTTKEMDFNTGSYCPVCKSITGMGLTHCNECKKCVPDKWKHCYMLERCCDKSLRNRWVVMFKLVVCYFLVTNLIYAMVNVWILSLVPIHITVLKSTYTVNKMGINNKYRINK
jgi:hypothetical protein